MSESLIVPATTDATPAPAEKQEVLHRKTFMGGRMTPKEAHRKWGIRRKCRGCGGPGACRIKVFMPLDEAMRRAPQFVALATVANPDKSGKLPTVKFKQRPTDLVGTDFLKASDTVWCDNCKVEARLEAARGAPSWAVVEIDDGIKDTIQVGA